MIMRNFTETGRECYSKAIGLFVIDDRTFEDSSQDVKNLLKETIEPLVNELEEREARTLLCESLMQEALRVHEETRMRLFGGGKRGRKKS